MECNKTAVVAVFCFTVVVVIGVLSFSAYSEYQETERIKAGCYQVVDGIKTTWKCPEKQND